jgi:hypothetical protein
MMLKKLVLYSIVTFDMMANKIFQHVSIPKKLYIKRQKVRHTKKKKEDQISKVTNQLRMNQANLRNLRQSCRQSLPCSKTHITNKLQANIGL